MKNIIFKKIFIISALFVFAQFLGQNTLAGYDFNENSGLNKTADKQYGAGYDTSKEVSSTDITVKINSYIKIILSFIGVIFLILMIYGGFIWMFARGNDTEVDKAKNIIKNAVIGLILISLAYAITMVVFDFYDQTQKPVTINKKSFI